MDCRSIFPPECDCKHRWDCEKSGNNGVQTGERTGLCCVLFVSQSRKHPEISQALQNNSHPGQIPVVQTVTNLISNATNPIQLAKMGELYQPWF